VFFGRTKSLVGLDIGSSSVKAVELKDLGKGRGYQLLNIGIEPLSPEAIVDGAIMDSGLVAETIQRLFTTSRIKSQEVAISLSGHSVIIKKISLPQMTQEELSESIQWEAEQYIPFDVDDVNIDYQVLEGASLSGEGNMDVLLVAVKKDKINDYTTVLANAGKTAQVVDVDVFALQNAYECNYDVPSDKVVALINMGAAVTNIAILQGGVSIFWRDITTGGNLFTEAIQKELNVPFDQAEALKKGQDVDGASAERVPAILQAVGEQVGTEIQKTLDFFKATSSSDPVSLMILAGGASRTSNLAAYLGQRFDTHVEMLDPFKKVAVNDRQFPLDTLEPLAPCASVAVGLALRKVGDR
jgi:type IV pilus assembly protein PilM